MSHPPQEPRWPLPVDEKERLRDLHCLDLLDTPREPEFDGVVELAKALLDAPMAAVTLVDSERQWFKAVEGLPVRETGREVSFCAHAIMSNQTMVVEDATLDPRFANNPLVTGEPGIRFYVGVPLVTHNRHRVGSLCVVDTVPRTIDPGSLRLLERLASLALMAIEARRPYRFG